MGNSFVRILYLILDKEWPMLLPQDGNLRVEGSVNVEELPDLPVRSRDVRSTWKAQPKGERGETSFEVSPLCRVEGKSGFYEGWSIMLPSNHAILALKFWPVPGHSPS
jgi:hypothetical protein